MAHKNKGNEGSGVPYRSHKAKMERKRAHSESGKASRDKVKSICGITAKLEAQAQSKARARWTTMNSEGKAGPRLFDGSWWEYGT